ncbi:MAG TPA: hypothetical protein PKE47_08695 [Verrucomicrobiota bacterium]|nr:hypothetical protein [Verrucomicrobiota bacterium]
MKAFFITILAVLMAGCQSSAPSHSESTAGPLTYSGGDGLSLEQAAVISGARDNMQGIKAEYAWLRGHYSGFKLTRQSIRGENGRLFDQLDIVTSDGRPLSIFFDITSFYGKGLGL